MSDEQNESKSQQAGQPAESADQRSACGRQSNPPPQTTFPPAVPPRDVVRWGEDADYAGARYSCRRIARGLPSLLVRGLFVALLILAAVALATRLSWRDTQGRNEDGTVPKKANVRSGACVRAARHDICRQSPQAGRLHHKGRPRRAPLTVNDTPARTAGRWYAGLLLAVVGGDCAVGVILTFARRRLRVPPAPIPARSPTRPFPHWVTGDVERLVFAIAVGIATAGNVGSVNPGGLTPVITAMFAWVVAKMAITWNDRTFRTSQDYRLEYYRIYESTIRAYTGLICGTVPSLMIAFIGGLICSGAARLAFLERSLDWFASLFV